MKNLSGFLLLTIRLAFFTVTFVGCITKPTSVQFFTGAWNELLTEARKQNKPIFIDVQTVWCGPCRMMEKQAFPNPEVAAKFNANFINYRIDMEKGDGPALRKKYAITAVPTLLYLSPDGELIYRSKGYDGIDALLADADKAVKAAEAPSELSALEARYKSGERATEFLRTYLIQRTRMGQPNPEAMETYLKRIPKTAWSSQENITLITSNSMASTSATFRWLLDFTDSLKNDPSTANTRWKIIRAADRVTNDELEQASTEADVSRVIDVRFRTLGTMSVDDKAFLTRRMWMGFYERTKNQAGYRKLALLAGNRLMAMSIDSLRAVDDKTNRYVASLNKEKKATQEQDSNEKKMVNYGRQSGYVASELNRLTKAYLAVMSSPVDLQQALVWSDRTVTLMPVWVFFDTHAQILGRLNRKADAIATQQRVISLAKAAGENTGDYEKTLAKLKQL